MEKNLTDELFFLTMKFLREEKYEESLHNLEKEWGMFFNWKHFEDLVVAGNWDEVESYLSAFTKVDENRYSMKMFFDIRKQKYLEALDRHDRTGALDILTKDLKVFESYNEEIFKEITSLITLQNFRENNKLAGYSDTKSARGIVLGELRKLAVMNPSIRQKMEFPNIETSRLRTLLNQSLNWQHSQCPDPRRTPDIKTLLEDHLCRKDPLPQPSSSTQHTATNGPFKPILVPHPIPLPTTENHPAVSAGGSGLAAVSKHLRDSDVVLRAKLQCVPQRTMLLRSDSRKSKNAVVSSVDEVPRHVGRILVHRSIPTCLEFHPLKQTLLLVGTYAGEIILWEVTTREKIASREFQLWHGDFCSMPLKTTLMKNPTIFVKCVRWSSDGTLFGVAYSKHLIQLYTYPGGSDIRHHLEIEAHVGDVNDIAFCSPSKQLCVISCGDDKTIKVWDVATGANLYTFEGHAAPVYSVCPHYKDNVHFLLSTSTDGTIKAWLFDQDGARVDYVVPGRACSTMKYSSDGKRLFSCGTNKSGESQVVEWYEKEGIVKRTYIGCTNHSIGVIHFDITKNRFIAVGDDYVIKIWDIDNVNLLSTLDAEGGLQASPRIRFNKDGNLLAVTANDNKIKVLATMAGIRFMDSVESQSHMSPIEAETITKNGGTRNAKEVRPNLTEERTKGSRKLTTEINEVAQLRLLRLSAILKTDKILRLLYTHSSNSILALASNGVHLIWKWTKDEQNSSGQATTKVAPQLMQPISGMLMVNDLTNAKLSDALPCCALSKNDSYIVSTSGGKVSLFNMVTHKVLASFMCPPPAPTYLALDPKDNNIMAVGTEDGAIHIYNVPVDKVETKFKAHSKRVTSLAFSVVLNALVSSGADGKIITWNLDNWEKTKSTSIKIPIGRVEMASSDVQIQFLLDQKHMLVVHETQLAIYDASELECLKQWIEKDCMTPISHAVLSCDNQLVYASFLDGIVRVLALPNFQLRCLINPSAYLPEDSCYSVLPKAVAANPLDPNQFAVGLTDGTVVVFEPPEADGKWVVVPRPTPADEVKLVSM